MLELDLVLAPFVENVYEGLPESDQALFDKLLEEEDQDLFRWFLGNGEPEDADLKYIVGVVLENTGIRGEFL
jgi:antitoxin CptB